VVEHMPVKCEALSSNASTGKKKSAGSGQDRQSKVHREHVREASMVW
jgi:hypothetical protein